MDIFKRELSLVAVLAVAAPLAAQGPRASGGIGVKAGLSYGDVRNSGVFPGGAKTRAGGAFGIGIVTGGPIGFGFEALSAQRGIIGSSGNSRELDYIDIPAYVRIAAMNTEIEPFGYLGPQISYELKCDSNGGSCPSGRDKFTYAGVIGGGLRFQRAAGLSVEARYIYRLDRSQVGHDL